jgi:hypothetical protein
MKAWSEMTSAERTEACVELAENHDMSYLQIANLYKTTRNVIAGTLNRYKAKGGVLVGRRAADVSSRTRKPTKNFLAAKPKPKRWSPTATEVDAIKVKPAGIEAVRAFVTPARVAPIRMNRPVVPPPDGLNILDLNDHVCRWPLGEGPYSFCGAPTVLSASGWKVYCGVHNAAAYIPREKKPSKRSR